MQTDLTWVRADWQVADTIVAGTTTRSGGHSTTPALAENNLGINVGDTPRLVRRNRRELARLIERQGGSQMRGPVDVQWLEQVHGSDCVYVGADSDRAVAPLADAMWTDRPGLALAIQSADCVPVVMTDTAGTVVGAAHGGWRGLVAGVLPRLVSSMPVEPSDLHAWVGPCIGRTHFEVGEDVWRPVGRSCVEAVHPHATDNHKRRVDLPLLTQRQLQACGVRSVSQSGLCTYDRTEFYSHRRATHGRGQGAQTGRMATFICRIA
jgi:YfiH family protein